jgi:hypothetical protein
MRWPAGPPWTRWARTASSRSHPKRASRPGRVSSGHVSRVGLHGGGQSWQGHWMRAPGLAAGNCGGTRARSESRCPVNQFPGTTSCVLHLATAAMIVAGYRDQGGHTRWLGPTARRTASQQVFKSARRAINCGAIPGVTANACRDLRQRAARYCARIEARSGGLEAGMGNSDFTHLPINWTPR